MPTVTQNKPELATQQLCGCIAGLPGGDVVSEARDNIGIIDHFGQINRRSKHLARNRTKAKLALLE